MATRTPEEPTSDLPYHPGEFAAEEAAARGLTPADLAAALGWSFDEVLEFLECRIAVTLPLAEQLSAVLGVSAASWLNLQMAYERSIEHNRRHATA